MENIPKEIDKETMEEYPNGNLPLEKGYLGDYKSDSEGDSEGDSDDDSGGDSDDYSEGDSEGDSDDDSEGDSEGDSDDDDGGYLHKHPKYIGVDPNPDQEQKDENPPEIREMENLVQSYLKFRRTMAMLEFPEHIKVIIQILEGFYSQNDKNPSEIPPEIREIEDILQSYLKRQLEIPKVIEAIMQQLNEYYTRH